MHPRVAGLVAGVKKRTLTTAKFNNDKKTSQNTNLTFILKSKTILTQLTVHSSTGSL